MFLRRLLSRKFRFLLAVAAVILAMPLLPAQATPCDSYHLDLEALPRRQLEVVVAMDQAWQEAHGVLAEGEARSLIADTDRILEPTGVDLIITGYRAWDTGGEEFSMSQLLHHLDDAVAADPGQIVIGLTGRQHSRVDGIAHVGHVHIVARRHPGRPEYDGLVVAHEIGHLLGAGHHECDHDYRCVMTPKGFGLPARWCDHHVLEIQMNAASLAAE